MLNPEDFRELRPKFEDIRLHLEKALACSEVEVSEESLGHFTIALTLMEELSDEIEQKHGFSIRQALTQVASKVKSAEGAGAVGGLGGAATALSFTGLGGFGLAAGGTAVGVSGLAGATVATGGAGLAGAAAVYLAYKAGAAALNSEAGQKAVDEAGSAGSMAVAQAREVRDKAVTGFNRMRRMRIKLENPEDESSQA